MDPVGLNEPLLGSYSSADARTLALSAPSVPPVIRTLPPASKVAVCSTRGVDIEPVGPKEPVPGSYSSADSKPSKPPVIRTLPFASKVAVSQHRALDIDPVELNRPRVVEAGIAAGVAVRVAAGVAVSVAIGVAVGVAVGLWELTSREARVEALGVAPAQPASANKMTTAIAAHLLRPRELAKLGTPVALLLVNARPQGRRLRTACDGHDGR